MQLKSFQKSLVILSGVMLLQGAAMEARAFAAPSITAVVAPTGGPSVTEGNFSVQGSGFTPGNGLISVWLQDFTAGTLLWYTPAAFAFPNGGMGVTGPMHFTPPDAHFAPRWAPEVSIPCGHNVRVIAKDGAYEDANAAWSNLSDNLSVACPQIR